MSITYSISDDNAMIYEVWLETITIKDLERYWTKYLKDPNVMAIRRTLVDLRHADVLFTGQQLSSSIRRIVVPALQGKDWITALLVDRPVHFGISRQYQVFAELYSQDSIFDDPEKAESWLRQQSHKDGSV